MWLFKDWNWGGGRGLCCALTHLVLGEHTLVFKLFPLHSADVYFISALGKAKACGQHLASIFKMSCTRVDTFTPFNAFSKFHIHSANIYRSSRPYTWAQCSLISDWTFRMSLLTCASHHYKESILSFFHIRTRERQRAFLQQHLVQLLYTVPPSPQVPPPLKSSPLGSCQFVSSSTSLLPAKLREQCHTHPLRVLRRLGPWRWEGMLTTFPESRRDLETVTPSSADDFDSFKNLFTSHEIGEMLKDQKFFS